MDGVLLLSVREKSTHMEMAPSTRSDASHS